MKSLFSHLRIGPSVWPLLLLLPVSAFAKTFYVTPEGTDRGSGDRAHPFATVAHALTRMKTGDTCLLLAGTYREAITLNKPGVTIAAGDNGQVTITGCVVLDASRGKSYSNPLNGAACFQIPAPEPVHQLFVDGRRLNLARWPDKSGSMLSMKDWEESQVDAAGETKTATFAALPEKETDYWKGAFYVGMNDGRSPQRPMNVWYSATGQVASSQGRVLHLNRTGYGLGSQYANGPGLGYLVNCLGALDAPGEWYWNDGYLYLIPPGGVDLRKVSLEARTRLDILTIEADDVTVRGLGFKAGTALIRGNRARLEKCSFRYLSPFVWNEAGPDRNDSGARCNWGDFRNGSSGICVLGNGLVMQECYVAHSWFSGLVLWGDSCRVENCIIEDVNWISKRCAGINSYGAGNIVRHCTIRDMGVACIEGGNGNWLKKYALRNVWEHNLLQNVGLLGADGNGAFMYVNHQDGSSPASASVWRYNLCIRNRGPDKGTWGDAPSLYVDNNSSGYLIHHNIIIDAKLGIRYNDFLDGERAGRSIAFVNNTFFHVERGMAYGLRPESTPDAGLTVENNLGVDCGGFGHLGGRKDFGPSNVSNAQASAFRDPVRFDFSLVEPRYIDSGVRLPGIDLPYAGAAPDLGACETGLPAWKAGANWEVDEIFRGDEPPAPGSTMIRLSQLNGSSDAVPSGPCLTASAR